MSRSFITPSGVTANALQKNKYFLLEDFILKGKTIPIDLFGSVTVDAIGEAINYLKDTNGGKVHIPPDNNHFALDIQVHRDRNGNQHINFHYNFDRYPTLEGRPYTSESWQVGDIIRSTQVEESKCLGWVCVQAGIPGTWIPYGWSKKFVSEVEMLGYLPDASELQEGRHVIHTDENNKIRSYYCLNWEGKYQWVQINPSVRHWDQFDVDDLVNLINNQFGVGLPSIKSAAGKHSVLINNIYSNIASGKYSTAEGSQTKATGDYSHAENYGNISKGPYSHSEGVDTQSTNYATHSEGARTRATGVSSHSEGVETQAQGQGSHSEGGYTRAYGDYSHSGGYLTIAYKNASYAGGIGTHANGEAQTAIGKYNDEDTTALFIVGNGTSDNNRSNAFLVTRDGTIESTTCKAHDYHVSGTIYLGDTSLTEGTLIKLINFIDSIE